MSILIFTNTNWHDYIVLYLLCYNCPELCYKYPGWGLIVTSKNYFFMHEFRSLNIAISQSFHFDCKDEEGRLLKRRIRVVWLNPFLLQCQKSKKCYNIAPPPRLPQSPMCWTPPAAYSGDSLSWASKSGVTEPEGTRPLQRKIRRGRIPQIENEVAQIRCLSDF